MDKRIILAVLLLSLVSGIFFFVQAPEENISGSAILESTGKLRQAQFSIGDMYCQACAYGVEAQFKGVDGVLEAEVNYQQASGKVIYDRNRVDAKTIAVASTTYPATVVADIKIDGKK